jgi:CRISPR type II-A-associated protein Csn2
MKKLIYSKYDNYINLDLQKMHILIIENKREFFNYIMELKSQIENKEQGNFVLSEDNDIIDIHKDICLISDMFSFNEVEKKLSTSLYKFINSEVQASDVMTKYQEIVTLINQFIDYMRSHIPLKLDYTDEIDLKNLLKTFKVKASITNNSLLETIIDYIDFITNLLGKKTFVFVNLFEFLTENEIILLLEEMNLMEVRLILLENNDVKTNNINYVKFIIDKDLCEIT